MCAAWLFASCSLAVGLFGQAVSSPARYRSGSIPVLPALAVGGGEVFLEVQVSREGRVSDVTALRATAPFTDLVSAAVRGWQFVPARGPSPAVPPRAGAGAPAAIPSSVLVVGRFRAPAVHAPTLGESPKDVGPPSAGIPYPLATPAPPHPPLARSSGVVLVEALVDIQGMVSEVRVLRSAPPFDGAAEKAVRSWRFRPAQAGGKSVAAFVYVILGFPEIVGAPGPVPHLSSRDR